MRASLLVLGFLLCWPLPARAEWQIQPFVGLTFGGDTTLVNLSQDAGERRAVVGINGRLLGEVFGIEGDVGHTSGFFGDEGLIVKSGVTTITANVIVGLPREWMRYTLRPYLVAGGGVIRVRADDFLGVLPLDSRLNAFDLGGGATGFLNDRVGLNWELRYFRSVGRGSRGVSFGEEQLSFWRATMALVIRLDRGSP
jgi:hypothetical protein